MMKTEMSNDLISRADAMEALLKIKDERDSVYYTSAIYSAVEALKQLPSAQERKTGRWIECDHEKWIVGVHALRCSECGGGYHLNNEMTIYYWNYCPVCGAKMEVEHETD